MKLSIQKLHTLSRLPTQIKFLLSCYPSTHAFNSNLLYLWYRNTYSTNLMRGTRIRLNTSVNKVASKQIPARLTLFSRTQHNNKVRPIKYSGILRCIQKRPSNSLNTLFRRSKTGRYLNSMWLETYLASLTKFSLIGFTSDSNSKRIITPNNVLNVYLNPFRRVPTSYDPQLPKNSFETTMLISETAKTFFRYLSLRKAKLAMSEDEVRTPLSRLFRKVFVPRTSLRKRLNLPNPYLFLGLKNSFTPTKSTPLQLFRNNIRTHHLLQTTSSSTPKNKMLALSAQRQKVSQGYKAYVERQGLRFLKSYSTKGAGSINQRLVKSVWQNVERRNQRQALVTLKPTCLPYQNSKMSRTNDVIRFITPRSGLPTASILKLLSQTGSSFKQLTNPNTSLFKLKNLLRTFHYRFTINGKFARLAGCLNSRLVSSSNLIVKFTRHSRPGKGLKLFCNFVRPKQTLLPVSRANHQPVPVHTSQKTFNSLAILCSGKLSPLKRLQARSLKTLTLVELTLPLWPLAQTSHFEISSYYLTPAASYGFVRSPFFFTHFWSTNQPSLHDSINLGSLSISRHSYLIFPEANTIKTVVFRNLTSQRLLAQSRNALFNLTNNSISLLPEVLPHNNTGLKRKGELSTTLTPISNVSTLWSLWYLEKVVRASAEPQYRFLKPKRIRFKPGYSRMWRIARTSIKEILNIKAHYQYRLNPKLQKYYFQNRNLSQLRQSLTVEFALMSSHYVPDRSAVYSLLDSNNVFLNGQSITNNHLRLFVNDFIQLVVHLKFYIALRWLRSLALLRNNRTSKIFYRKYRPSTFNKNIRVVRDLPRWFFDIESTYGDIPRFLEVDYFTLSIFVLPYPIISEKLLPSRSYEFDPTILNMYNWKYIT